jgi:hypothetical protein
MPAFSAFIHGKILAPIAGGEKRQRAPSLAKGSIPVNPLPERGESC